MLEDELLIPPPDLPKTMWARVKPSSPELIEILRKKGVTVIEYEERIEIEFERTIDNLAFVLEKKREARASFERLS